MDFVSVHEAAGITTLVLKRGKVNALNEIVVEELHAALTGLEEDPTVKAVILTGNGKFFSFGFDIPQFLPYSREQFSDYLVKFTDLYTYMFLYPKPVVAALNGHAIAGGCMLTLAGDRRVMVSGKARISLNEISFGSSVFAGSTEMLRFCVGGRNATQILYSGAMYSAEEAQDLGLIDRVTIGEDLTREATELATEMSAKPAPAFAGMKLLLRGPVAEEMKRKEARSIKEFLDIWYSDATRENLKNIKIY
jgi:enoyl-CoA hydratase/carnithine racemase